MKQKIEIIEEKKFFTLHLLREANEAAHREKRSRCINPETINLLPLDFVYHVLRFTYHKKNELRLFVQIDAIGNFELLDVSVTRYESLPTIIYFEDGSFDLKPTKRPYPNGRQWQETEVKKPLRKQAQFRRMVLAVYENCCSVCGIQEMALLRAAHILDVKNGGPDTIENGICLCVNHEIAFDAGIMRINSDYTLFGQDRLGLLRNEIRLPKALEDRPSPIYLQRKLELIDGIKPATN